MWDSFGWLLLILSQAELTNKTKYVNRSSIKFQLISAEFITNIKNETMIILEQFTQDLHSCDHDFHWNKSNL